MCIQEISNIRVLLFQSENVSGPNSKAISIRKQPNLQENQNQKKKKKKV